MTVALDLRTIKSMKRRRKMVLITMMMMMLMFPETVVNCRMFGATV